MSKATLWIIINIIFLSISFNAFSNNKKDSLINVTLNGTPSQKTNAFCRLASSTKDFNKAMTLYDSAEYYYSLSPNDTDLMYLTGFKAMSYSHNYQFDKVIKNAHIAAKIGERIDRPKDVAAMYITISKAYRFTHHYDSLILYRKKAISIYKKLLAEKRYPKNFCILKIAQSNVKIGQAYFWSNRYTLAIEYLYYAIKGFDKINNYKGLTVSHLNLGNVYNYNHNYDRALEEYQTGLKYANIIKAEPYKCLLNTNIGTIFFAKEQYDSANYYFDISLEYLKGQKDEQNSIAGIYNNKALIYKHTKQFDKAIEFFNKAIERNKKHNNKMGIITNKINIGITLLNMGKYNEGEKILLQTLEKSKKYKMGESTKEIYYGLSEIYKHNHQYKKALEAFTNYVTYKDSINSIDVTNKLNKYKEQYEAEKKDQEIKLLEQQAKVRDLKQQQQKAVVERQKIIGILLGIIILFLVIAIVYTARYFKLKQKAAQEMIAKNAEISQQRIVDLIKEQEVKSISSFMNGQEKERSRIAAELHDRLGSLLSAVKLHFSSIEADIDENNIEERESFNFALNLLDNSVDEVRSISHNLSKGILMQFDLSEAISNLANTINTAGNVKVQFIEAGPDFNLNPEAEVELFRVIQELITNAIKHSQADKIFVQKITDDEGLRIIVEDQGVGFNIKKIKNNGMGLFNLKSRINKIGGKYTIESIPGQGTTIIIEINND